MAKKSLSYDHPLYLARYSANVNCHAVAASKSANKFIAFAAMKVKSVQGNVNIAGTDTAAGYDLYHGTTSIGEFVTSTNTAGSALAAILPGQAMVEGEVIEFRTKANSATLAASFIVEYELVPGADITA